MAQDLAPIFGNGSDGVATLSGTDAPIDSSFSGTLAALTGSATNASFTANQKVLIHQSRGTGAGQWEINEIASYVAGTITFKNPLAFTYTDSGASQAQVRVLNQYSAVTISGTLTAKAWDGNVGGIIAFLCSGRLTVSGSISANGGDGITGNGASVAGATGGGFRGGDGITAAANAQGIQGEGTSGAGTGSTSANGNGGGGGLAAVNIAQGGGGGNGGGGTAGAGTGGNTGGGGGGTAGAAALTTLVFGGGGGGGSDIPTGGSPVGSGGSGGGAIVIFTKEITVSGSISANGGDGGVPGNESRAGGCGAGGSILIKTQTSTLGSSLISAIGGSYDQPPGTGGAGRIAINACSISGTTNPAATTSVGNPWCGEIGGMI